MRFKRPGPNFISGIEISGRPVCERKLAMSDTPLRNSVEFLVALSLRRAGRRRLVTIVEVRMEPSAWPSTGSFPALKFLIDASRIVDAFSRA